MSPREIQKYSKYTNKINYAKGTKKSIEEVFNKKKLFHNLFSLFHVLFYRRRAHKKKILSKL